MATIINMPPCYVQVSDFQKFDHGGVATAYLDGHYDNLKIGDIIPWELGQFDGQAVIIGIRFPDPGRTRLRIQQRD